MPKGKLIVDGNFEWWSEKEEENIRKHKLEFREIEAIFDDPYFYEIYDEKHSTITQDRCFGIGSINGFCVIATSYTENERIHIINARIASPQEEKIYDKYRKQMDG